MDVLNIIKDGEGREDSVPWWKRLGSLTPREREGHGDDDDDAGGDTGSSSGGGGGGGPGRDIQLLGAIKGDYCAAVQKAALQTPRTLDTTVRKAAMPERTPKPISLPAELLNWANLMRIRPKKALMTG